MKHWFEKFADTVSYWMSTSWAFLIAVSLLVYWFEVSGKQDPQMTGDMIIAVVGLTYLFLNQRASRHAAAAWDLKFAEILRAIEPADTAIADADLLDSAEIAERKKEITGA